MVCTSRYGLVQSATSVLVVLLVGEQGCHSMLYTLLADGNYVHAMRVYSYLQDGTYDSVAISVGTEYTSLGSRCLVVYCITYMLVYW